MRTMTFEELVAFFSARDHFLITTHSDPDGDAVGSELGLVGVLRAAGKNARILNSDASSHKLLIFDGHRDLQSLEEGAVVPDDVGRWTVILIDTADFLHTRRAKDQIIPLGKEVVVIDHHTPPAQLPCAAYIDDSAAASAQIVYQLAEALGVADRMDLNTANALFMGIVFDTGSFIYPKTTPLTFRAAQRLVELGVRPKEIHSALYETVDPSKMRLQALVQGNMTLHHGDRTALQVMTRSMLDKTGAAVEDSENFINYPLKCTTVLVSIFLKEAQPGVYRCSLRSKGTVDVSVLAQARGGGGHRTAAGFPCPSKPLADLESELLQSVLELYPKD